MSKMDYVKTLIGSIITAAAFGLFILPLNYATGGVTGFSKLINVILGMQLYQVVMAANVALFLLGSISLGKAFASKTVIAALSFPCALKVFQSIHLFGESFRYPIPMAIVAGVVLGCGGGLIIRSHGSGCGMDVIALVINKYKTISIGIAVNAFDILIMLIQAAELPLVNTISGVIVSLVCAPVMNFIISYKPQQNKELC